MEKTLKKENAIDGRESPCAEETIREVDLALAGKDENGETPAPVEGLEASRLTALGFSRLPQALRWLGTTALIVAAAAYMIQGVGLSATMERHWTFVVMTGILGALGLSFGLAAREVKGGRTFLGLAAATVPVHFSQLGGMIHALVGEPPRSMPEALVFSAAGPASVALTAVATIALLLPLTYFGFSIFARAKALPLTIAYFLSSAVILLPLRENGTMAGIIVLTAAATIGADRRLFGGDARLQSFEGRIVRSMFASVLLILLGRSFFYPLNALYVSTLLTAAGLFLFFDSPRLLGSARGRPALQAAGAVIASLGWLVFIAYRIEPITIPSSELYILFLPLAAILYSLSFFSLGSGRRYRLSAAAAAVATLTGVHLASASPSTSLAAFIGGAALIAAGVAHGERWPFFSGMASVATGLSYHLRYALELYAQNLWLSLAATGICTLILASFFELKGERLRRHFNRHRARLKSWN